jgi:flap endonuclease-1
MGIKHLNSFLKDNAAKAIKTISLSELSGKKISIDINNYMHKYAAEDTLIENMYSMLSIFRYYNIIPIFIFDGKPPPEKKELLLKRREHRKESMEEYNRLQNTFSEITDENEKQDTLSKMNTLKRSFVQITKNDIEIVKQLITAYGAMYYDAPGEADELCAFLAIKNKVWATLSDDMDMFVYGSPNIIRYLSLMNHTAVCYNMNVILQELGITQKDLREICVLSGTDYNNININNSKNNINLHNTLKLFKKYLKEIKKKNINQTTSFYDWIFSNTSYIDDYDLLMKIYSMFDLNLKTFETIKIAYSSIMKSEIKEILKKDGFLFPFT